MATSTDTEPQLHELAKDALRVLSVLLDPQRVSEQQQFFAAVTPKPEDFPRVFVPQVAERLAALYAPMFAQPLTLPYSPAQTVLRVAVALSDDFAKGDARADSFPGGYKQVAQYLVPGIPWVRWEALVPGEDAGMSTDGLVRLGDRWVWFPKAYRAIEAVRMESR